MSDSAVVPVSDSALVPVSDSALVPVSDSALVPMSDSAKASEGLKELGNQAFASKNFEDAIKHYSSAIKLDPSNHVFFSNRSASYAGLQDWKQSAEDAKECIRLDPSFIKGYYRLSTAQIELRQYDGATATIRQGLGLDSNNAQLLKQMRIIKQLQKVEAAKLASPKPSGAGGLDEAASRELRELQVQYGQTNKEFGTVQANLNMTEREYKMAELTKKELEEVPEETKCYRSIGKMFMQSTQGSVLEHLDKQMSENKKKDSEMTQKMEYLERRMKSQRQNMEELMSPS